MNILYIVEKPSIAKLVKESLERINDNNSNYFDYVRATFNIKDPILRFRKHNGIYYQSGTPGNWKDLQLKSISLPNGTYLQSYDSQIAFINHMTLPKIDKIICFCDPDISGRLAFIDYLEQFNISFDDAYIYDFCDLTNDSLDKLFKTKPIPFNDFFIEFKKDLINNNYELDTIPQRNISILRFESKLNRTDFANFFNIPYRTLENWEKGLAKCPDYLYDLMEYKLLKEEIFFKN